MSPLCCRKCRLDARSAALCTPGWLSFLTVHGCCIVFTLARTVALVQNHIAVFLRAGSPPAAFVEEGASGEPEWEEEERPVPPSGRDGSETSRRECT
jgi:hypothetical protein